MITDCQPGERNRFRTDASHEDLPTMKSCTTDDILFFEKYDLQNIVTPVDVEKLHELLCESHYNEDETKYLIDGFVNGFDLGYRGPEQIQQKSPNLKIPNGVGSERILWIKVMKEVKLKRYAGPFEQIPFEFYIQSPIGLVPKDNGSDVRLIFHLSYPRGTNKSVNCNTPPELCKVAYPDFSKAIKLCEVAGRNCKIAWSDMRSAFRNLSMRKSQWRFLIMMARSPIDGKIYYFVDKCMPFGASISCSHFQ